MWYIIIYENKQKVRLLNMPIPKYDLPEYKPDETELKADIIVRKLSKMGYSVNTERDAVHIIDSFNLDKSQFDFPYHSFEEFKKHVLAGEFDYDEESFSSSEEEIEALHKAVKEGKLWITY